MKLQNELGKQLFERIFGHKFTISIDKLINTTSKEENQVLINNIRKKRR